MKSNFSGTMKMLCFQVILVLFNAMNSLAVWNTNDYIKREHSVVRPYQASGVSIPYWDFSGSTMITNNYIRLTPDLQSKSGAVWNNIPCTVRNWELQIHFKVHGKGKDLYGDGMAIWYTKQSLVAGPVFGNQDYFDGLGIFLDTYANQGAHSHGHPYISAMVNNGTLHYDHDRDGTHTELAGCESKFRNSEHDSHLSIRYERDVLTVSTDVEGKNAWKECFSVEGVKLPTGYFFGGTATTGDLSDNHDIISIRLYELEIPDYKDEEDRSKISPKASFFAPPRDHIDDQPPAMSGFKLFLIIVCVLLGICVCIIGGVIVFQRSQDRSKRLY
ncbi:vesicular integral-membrane protein VIP36 [Parasteatoda tepidariorum]|uniref:vesicular integral-membrane protein VIP36 n=1 Tax=Parasteatoda tepidariorum TaxID=114398 RepID=UPI00077FC286|nr:vesicular integral-membrane protein VIP36 [Parasteatoda tepidariorum]